MSKRAKGALIHGMINLLLPYVLVVLHSGAFSYLFNNPWDFFFIGIFLAIFPILSSVAGILITGILLKKSHERMLSVALLLSIIGLTEQILFRFVWKI